MYSLTRYPNVIQRDADGALIPADPDNMDYLAFRARIDEGNEPNPEPLPPGIEVTGFRQAGHEPKGRRR